MQIQTINAAWKLADVSTNRGPLLPFKNCRFSKAAPVAFLLTINECNTLFAWSKNIFKYIVCVHNAIITSWNNRDWDLIIILPIHHFFHIFLKYILQILLWGNARVGLNKIIMTVFDQPRSNTVFDQSQEVSYDYTAHTCKYFCKMDTRIYVKSNNIEIRLICWK